MRQYASIAILGALIFAFVGPARAVNIVGAGTMSCSDWTKQNMKAAPNEVTRIAQAMEKKGRVGWVLGFLSGLNVQSGGPIDIFKAPSPTIGNEIEVKVDKYCIAHPDVDVVHAANTIAKDLFERQRK